MLSRTHFRNLYKYHQMLDSETIGHSHRVAVLMRELSREMNFLESDCLLAYVLGYIHDCGKYYLPRTILQKPGPLTAEEFDKIKQHPLFGTDIVLATTGSRELANVIAAHHERLDGSGYPYGLQERDIMPLSRMLSVCDSFEAMTARRSYRSPMTTAEAAAELQRCADVQFDAMVVDIFVNKVLPVWKMDRCPAHVAGV